MVVVLIAVAVAVQEVVVDVVSAAPVPAGGPAQVQPRPVDVVLHKVVVPVVARPVLGVFLVFAKGGAGKCDEEEEYQKEGGPRTPCQRLKFKIPKKRKLSRHQSFC